MKLSKYIKILQIIHKVEGVIDCYYSSDEEGNSFNQVFDITGVVQEDENGGMWPIDEDELKELADMGCEPWGAMRRVLIVN